MKLYVQQDNLTTEENHMNSTNADIITHFEYTPLPIRDFDWSATFDNYEPDGLVGWGATAKDAIDHLLERQGDSK
jgi:hypothetical protein